MAIAIEPAGVVQADTAEMDNREAAQLNVARIEVQTNLLAASWLIRALEVS